MTAYTIKLTDEEVAQREEYRSTEKAAILCGKIRIRWSQARCGYEIRSGRNAVIGCPLFVCESDATAWLKENHGINLS